jgi:hypothetical protein
MAEADVKVQLKADILGFVRDMKIAEKQLKSFGNQARTTALSSGASRMERDFAGSSIKIKKHFDQVDKAIQNTGKMLGKVLMTAIKGTMLQMAAMGAVMVGIHASFAVGRGIMKAYGGAMKIVAQGGAAVAVALSTAAAAMREQQAAMFAYKGKGASQLGGGLNQTRAAMRALAADANLAVIGTQGLNKAYAAMSKSMTSTQISGSRNMFKALMDFGSAGQDPGAAAEKVGVLIAALNDTKKTIGDVQAAAKGLGPEMEKAFKQSGIKTKKQFKEMLMSGELARKGGVFGQFDAVNGTLINQAKAFFSQIKVQFEQFGDKFLNPAKEAFFKIKNIIRKDITRVYAELEKFGTGNLFDGIVKLVEKLSGFFVTLVRDWLPKASNQFGRIGDWMGKFRRGWDLVLEKLRPFIAGARVIESIFTPIWKTLKEQGVGAMKDFNKNLQENAPYFKELGQRVAGLLASVMEFGRTFRQIFFSALPFINDVLAGVKSVFDALKGFIGTFSKSLGGAGLLGLMMISRQMKSHKGGYAAFGAAASQNVQTMNVAQMNVGGAPIGGQASSGRSLASGATSSATSSAAIAAAQYKFGGPVNAGAQTGASVAKGNIVADYRNGMTLAAIPAGVGIAQNRNPFARMFGGRKFNKSVTNALRNPTPSMGYGAVGSVVYPVGPTIGTQLKDRFGANALKGSAMASLTRNKRLWNMRAQNAETGKISEVLSAPELKAAGISSPGKLFRSYRESAGFARIFGNEKLGIKGWNQSLGAKMGTSIGLSLLSQMAPEEMRGSLALGGMIGQFNPLAGAAVGFGGAALKSKTPIRGALSGAAAGAALGSVLPGVGTAAGAAIGALGGALMGAANRTKEQAKKAKAAVTEGFDSLTKSMVAARYSMMEQNAKNIAAGKKIANRGAFEGFATKITGGAMAIANQNRGATKGLGTRGRITNAVDIATMAGPALRILSEIPGLASIDKPLNWVKGFFSGGNEREKKQKEAVKNIIKYMEDNGAALSESQIKDMNKNRGATIKQFEKTAKAEKDAAQMLDTTYSKRLTELEKISGKTRPELELLAKDMGVNLYDSTVKFKDVVKQLGLGMAKTADQMRQAFTDVYVAGFDVFQQYKKQAEAAKSYNEVAENFRALSANGGATNTDFFQFMTDLSSASLDMFGGDALTSFYDMTQQLGYKGKTGNALKTGGVFANVAGEFNTPERRKMLESAFGTMESGFAKTGGQQLSDILAEKGFTANNQVLTSQILGLAPAKQEALLRSLQAGTFDVFGNRRAGQTNTDLIAQNLAGAGLDVSKLNLAKMPTDNLDKVATAMGTASDDFSKAVTKFVDGADAAFKNITTPEWLKNGNPALLAGNSVPVKVVPGDTSFPRGIGVGDTTSSRLSQTMARHSAIDGTLSGKRTITSSYRTWGLGSLGSDHLTGRAIDVVGDNLVSYRDAVRSNGGFAEFHGNGANRHVHAVPGPMGDGAAPSSYTRAASQRVVSGGGMNVTIHINGANASPDDIANRVLAKIKDAERAKRERS